MQNITATEARSTFFNLVKTTIKTRKEYRITSKEGNAVLLSEDDYESLLETLELLSTPGFLKSIRQAKKDIKAGKTYSLDEVFGKP